MSTLRADLYLALAEVLGTPPEWLALPARDWPLYTSAAALAEHAPAIQAALPALGAIAAEPQAVRVARYDALFAGRGRPQIWPYESVARGGHLFGPESFALRRVYQAAGLEAEGAEAPDHASLELAFLAHLAALAGEALAPLERQFLQQHAGCWLPALGQALAQSGDAVYAPIGHLLAGWLGELLAPPRARGRRVPVMVQVEACTLCGFCASVCSPHALAIHETAQVTTLVLAVADCTGCGQCLKVCEEHVLKMELAPGASAERASQILRQSPRAACRTCGQPLVSQAELDFVAARLGNPAWLAYCSDCRSAYH